MFLNAVWKMLEVSACYNCFNAFIGGGAFSDFIAKEWLQVQDGEAVLDIGCGPAMWLSFFPEISYTGFDINPNYVAAARRRYGERGKFFVASVDEVVSNQLDRYDLVMAMGVLHHLSDEQSQKIIQLAADVLRPGGRFVTLDGVICTSQSLLARAIVLSDRGRFMRDESEYDSLLKSVFRRVDYEIFDGFLRIPYTHVIARSSQSAAAEAGAQKRCGIARPLKRSGGL